MAKPEIKTFYLPCDVRVKQEDEPQYYEIKDATLTKEENSSSFSRKCPFKQESVPFYLQCTGLVLSVLVGYSIGCLMTILLKKALGLLIKNE